jgi:hypothetical protein
MTNQPARPLVARYLRYLQGDTSNLNLKYSIQPLTRCRDTLSRTPLLHSKHRTRNSERELPFQEIRGEKKQEKNKETMELSVARTRSRGKKFAKSVCFRVMELVLYA